MINVTVLYPNRPGMKFDMDYYLSHHIPMTERLLAPAIKKATVERGILGGAPEAPPTYAVTAILHFDSLEAFMAAWGPVAAEVQADVPNYTDVEPVIQINEILK